MDARTWRARFEGRARPQRPQITVASPLPAERRAAVLHLLRQYAGGEAVEQQIASVLMAGAESGDDRVALECLLGDEAFHAELLLGQIQALGSAVPASDPDSHPKGLPVAHGSRPAPRPEFERLAAVFRVLGFLDTIVAFHVLEVAVAATYRMLRDANRADPALCAVFDQILGDEAMHCAFHADRIVAALRTASPVRRWRMRLVHVIARRLLVTTDRSVAPHPIYEQAMGVSFEVYKRTLRASYERAYRGELEYLRTGKHAI